MEDAEDKVRNGLSEITECSICMNEFTDPRVLPCIHTFCLQCLDRTSKASAKNPRDSMACPLCRKEFIIPTSGMNSVQKNFFMENLLEFKTVLQMPSSRIICDICNFTNDAKPKASMRCLECKKFYCDSCVKVHQYHNLTKSHHLVKIESYEKSEMEQPVAEMTATYCMKHSQKLLDYYCADCKTVVCVSCFVESHASHKCKDVNTVHAEFRGIIQRHASRASMYANEFEPMENSVKKRKEDFLKSISEIEVAIHKRDQELRDMINGYTETLLKKLSAMKSKHLRELKGEMEKIESHCTMFRSFESYCNELALKGTAYDICSSVDQLTVKAISLENVRETSIANPLHSMEVSLQITDLGEVLRKNNNNLLGNVTVKSGGRDATLGQNRPAQPDELRTGLALRQSPSTIPVRNIQVSTGTLKNEQCIQKVEGTTTKADSKSSADFRHPAWNAEKGAFDVSKLNIDQLEFFNGIGVSLSQLKDSETATFIYNAIQHLGGFEAINEEIRRKSASQGPPPPIPLRTPQNTSLRYISSYTGRPKTKHYSQRMERKTRKDDSKPSAIFGESSYRGEFNETATISHNLIQKHGGVERIQEERRPIASSRRTPPVPDA